MSMLATALLTKSLASVELENISSTQGQLPIPNYTYLYSIMLYMSI